MAVNANGAWSIFGQQVYGIVLYLIWAAEFLIILFLTAQKTQEYARVPYNENAGTWYKKVKLSHGLISTPDNVSDLAITIGQIAEGNITYLLNAPIAESSDVPNFKVTLYATEGAPDLYATIDSTVLKEGSKKDETETDNLVKYLFIPGPIAQNLLHRLK
jgi:hypothetical protein